MNTDHLPKIFITQDEVNEDDSSRMSLQQLLDQSQEMANYLPKASTSADGNQRDAIEAQLDENNYKLGSLLRDGNEFISNVIVANDRREVARRMKEAELREELVQILQAESAVAMQKFQEIASNWDELDEVKDPFNMNLGLEEQKVRIAVLMQQKDAIIAECRREVEKADENYYVDQEKHSEDLECLADRINNHIETMKRVYGRQLNQLQETIDQERRRIKRESNEAWNEIFDKRSEQEQLKLEQQKECLNQGDSELDKLVLEHEELIRATKVRLEKDNDCLQIELQKTKTNVLLNTQKLDYNFEVLKRREEENVVVRNQQKKRLTKLYDTVTVLRKNIRETSAKRSLDLNKLRNDATKLKTQIAELESSANLFADANDLKYKKIWEMNQEECMTLLREIQRMDSNISQNELGAAAISTNSESLLDITDLPSFQRAVEVVALGKSSGNSSKHDDAIIVGDEDLRKLFHQIVDKTGFIIEDKLKEILEPLQEVDTKLIKFSTFLNTFKIKTDSDLLIGVFRKYMWCSNCTSLLEQGCASHSWVVESEDILPALYELRLQMQRTAGYNELKSNDGEEGIKDTFSRLLEPKEVGEFWKQFEGVYPKDKEQIWTGLEYGLNQYLTVLKERESLYGECEQLRKQNEELNRLLQNHK